MADRIDIEIISSGGKDCLSIADQIVAGPRTAPPAPVVPDSRPIDESHEHPGFILWWTWRDGE
jgi:hypothetical protein